MFHRLYFQVVAILDQVMANRRVEKNCDLDYFVEYVLLELFVVVDTVVGKMGVNDNEVESVVLVRLIEAMEAVDSDDKVYVASRQENEISYQ